MFRRCKEGYEFKINKVKFEFLNPIYFRSSKGSSNDLSCVLRISNGLHSVLLTGDIEKSGERYLINYHSGQLRSDILIAPHHGSLSSSSKSFIKLIEPEYVIYGVGDNNRFGFPKLEILKRYHNLKSEQYSTASCGGIVINVAKEIKIETTIDNCKLKVK